MFVFRLNIRARTAARSGCKGLSMRCLFLDQAVEHVCVLMALVHFTKATRRVLVRFARARLLK